MRTIEFLRRKLPHPVVGIIAATLIALAGRGYLVWRSVGLLIITGMLAVEFLAWWLPKRHLAHLRWVFGATVTSLMFIVMMGVMYWWMDGELQDQQDEVFAKLHMSVTAPHSNNPFWSKFAVTNGSSLAIGSREIVCKPVLYVDIDGLVVDWRRMFNGAVAETWPSPDAELGPGNTETDLCVAGLGMKQQPICLDVVVEIRYSLVTQPLKKSHKTYRFVANQANGVWTWDEQPHGENLSYCASYAKRPS